MQYGLFQPPSEWVAPTEYPNLAGAKEIAIDLETRDPGLERLGPGWPMRNGEIIGVAVAVDGGQWYFPIGHSTGPNLDKRMTLAWLKGVCSDSYATYIFHNAQYDLGWLSVEGIYPAGRIVDTMVAAPLLDENRYSYSLNNLLKDYLGESKSERDLRDAAREFGLNPKSQMHMLPAMYVGKYAEQDAGGTLRLWQRLRTLLEADDLTSIFELECDLIPVLHKMRERGVRVDMERATQSGKLLEQQEKRLIQEVKKETGIDVEIWAADSISKAFDKLSLPYARTEKTGQPSFTKAFLKEHPHPVAKAIVQARELNKARSTFISTILEHNHNGRIHCEFHQLRSDEGGTVTGRLSCSNPNLQQVPARDPLIGPMIRGLFLPEQGMQWGAFDYSSQEPRLVAHYAYLLELPRAEAFHAAYQKDAHTDFHQIAADLVGTDRKKAKNINLGLFYGMGKGKLADQLGLPMDEAEELFAKYHAAVPFVRRLSEHCMNRANQRGVIRTLLGRRCNFNKWEPKDWNAKGFPKPPEEALAEYGPSIRRAYTYKALNKLIQGSAADQTKKAMLELYRAGILPMLQLHDELDVSVESKEDGERIMEIMENCVPMSIPSVVDMELGPTWGEAKTVFSDRPWSRGLADGGAPQSTEGET
jgi:DNA polymerase I-like protein with 3'-5' exonuclease and polymerase domains